MSRITLPRCESKLIKSIESCVPKSLSLTGAKQVPHVFSIHIVHILHHAELFLQQLYELILKFAPLFDPLRLPRFIAH